MTQDATTPLDALRATLAGKLGTDVLAARQSLIADGLNPDAKITFDERGNAPIQPEDRVMQQKPFDIDHETGVATFSGMVAGGFYEKLDYLEAEGAALLQTAETHVEDAGHTILAIGEHTLKPLAAAPHRIEMVMALPMARAGDVLHESEHAVIRAFLDVGDVLRKVYLNVHGLWVKA